MPKQDLKWLIDMLIPAMEGTRQRRKFIENEWLLNYRAWQGWPSQNYVLPLPDNAIHYFIPHARRAVERSVKRGTKLLMPNMDWHQTLPFDNKSHDNAEAVHNTLRYVYKKKYPTKYNISSGLRCLYMYNFSVLHTSALITNGEVWPWQETIDPFNFYIFPDTAINVEKALILFEDCIIPYQVYMSYVDTDTPENSLYENIKAEDLQAPEWPYHLVERLAYRGLTNPSDFVQGTGNTKTITEEQRIRAIKDTSDSLTQQSKAFVSLSKVYFRMASKWYFTVICTNIRGGGDNKYNCKVVRLDDTENKPLYHWCNNRPLPGELYTNSEMDDIRVLQNLTNNAMSQVESNRTRFAEPPLGVDANLIGRMEMKTFGNRQLWYFDGNPKEIMSDILIQDTSESGLRAFQLYKQQIDQSSGGGLPEGQPGRNMPRAGFATNTLLNMALVDVEDSADTYEQSILTPGLADTYHIILEYVPDSQLIKIPNKDAKLIKAYKKNDLTGDYSFDWLGSLGFQDIQVRADKFMGFLQTLLNPQALQVLTQQLSQQKMKLDFAGMLKTLYSYGLGEKGLGDIIMPMNDEEIQALNQPSPEIQAQQQDQQMSQQEHQQKMQQGQQKIEGDKQKFQLEMAMKQMDMRVKQLEAQLKMQTAQTDAQTKDLDMKRKQMDTHNKMLLSLSGTSNGKTSNG